MEIVVERGSEKRILGARRVVARNEHGEPKFLITLFEDVTERRELSREVERPRSSSSSCSITSRCRWSSSGSTTQVSARQPQCREVHGPPRQDDRPTVEESSIRATPTSSSSRQRGDP